MIQAIIVDDEAKGATTLKMLIEKYCPQVHIAGLYESVADAKEAVRKLQPQLVFLDIEMPFENGFHLLEQTREYKYEVIFTTAYNHYAINAIKSNALDYLLKPIDIEELVMAIEKAERKIENHDQNSSKDIENIINRFIAARSRKIALPSLEGISLVEPEEIICFEADSNYTYVYTTGNKKITVSKTLKTFEKIVEGMQFVRVHNSYIINFNQVEKYLKGDGGTLIMKNNLQIPVSRAHKQDLLQKIGVELI